ncbi:MAG: DUF2812 domain-containing protein [Halanaerobiales bacterium]|nr:DUF2812 domain-containing protein [Halanaerobiales bacterium]
MGKGKQKKFKFSMGLAFNEDKEMKMLSKMAKAGWIFSSWSKLGYNFKKGDPQDLIYCTDTYNLKEGESEQYFNLFTDAGWTHVCSVGSSIHFFSAQPNTKSIYTDKVTLAEKYENSKKDVHKAAIVLSIILVTSFLINILLNRFWNNEVVDFLVTLITGLSFGCLVAMIMTSIALNSRIKNL